MWTTGIRLRSGEPRPSTPTASLVYRETSRGVHAHRGGTTTAADKSAGPLPTRSPQLRVRPLPGNYSTETMTTSCARTTRFQARKRLNDKHVNEIPLAGSSLVCAGSRPRLNLQEQEDNHDRRDETDLSVGLPRHLDQDPESLSSELRQGMTLTVGVRCPHPALLLGGRWSWISSLRIRERAVPMLGIDSLSVGWRPLH
jgi:hypothetical protein